MCKCCSKHVPLPLYYVYIGSLDIVLCPTSAANLRGLLRWFKEYGKLPPGNIRKHYSQYIQALAEEMWRENSEILFGGWPGDHSKRDGGFSS